MLTLRVLFCILFSLTVARDLAFVKGPDSHSFSRHLVANGQPSMGSETVAVMAQPFRYWGQGSQFYVFLSRTERYMLKIPRAAKMGEGVIGRLLGGGRESRLC